MMKKLGLWCVVFSLLLVCASSSRAAITIFEDDFNSYAYALNWTGGGTWTVSNGTVDLIGAGTPYDLLPNGGMYVDMDGSSTPPDAGEIAVSLGVLQPGSYILTFDLAGHNSDPAYPDTDEVTVALGSFVSSNYVLAADAGWTTYTENFTVASATSATLSFEGAGGDTAGALLDNVSLSHHVPAPSAVLLGGIGAALVGWLRRRRIV